MPFSQYLVYLRKRGFGYFTLSQAMADLNLSSVAVRNAISRRKAYGDIISPAKGLYVIVPPEHQIRGSIPAEELVPILMNYLQIEYYVSLLSGAEYYGAAHQKAARFQIITTTQVKHPLEFGLIKLEVLHKKSLINLPIKDVVVNTGYLKVATPELVAFDLLLYQRRVGGLNHIATVLSELIEAINVENLISLGRHIKNKASIQRLGYLLDVIPSEDENKAKEASSELNKLLQELGGCVYIPLAPELETKGHTRNNKWKVIVNTTVESDI